MNKTKNTFSAGVVGISISETAIHAAVPDKAGVSLVTAQFTRPLSFNDVKELYNCLSQVRRAIRATSGKAIKAVLAVPLSLTPLDRVILRRCCEALGLRPMRIVPDITLAALHEAKLSGLEDALFLSVNSHGRAVDFGLYHVRDGICETLFFKRSAKIDEFKKIVKEAGLKLADLNEIRLLSFGGPKDMDYFTSEIRSLSPDSTFAFRPDYAVLGAFLLANILTGNVKDIVLLDVTPYGYGFAAAKQVTVLVCEHCWSMADDPHRKMCPRCRKKLAINKVPLITAEPCKIAHKAYRPLIKPNWTIPCVRAETVLIEDGCRAVTIHTADVAGNILTTNRIAIRKDEAGPGEGLYELAIGIDANQTARLSLKALQGDTMYRAECIPAIEMPKELSVFKSSKLSIKRRIIKCTTLRKLSDKEAADNGPILPREEVDALLRGI